MKSNFLIWVLSLTTLSAHATGAGPLCVNVLHCKQVIHDAEARLSALSFRTSVTGHRFVLTNDYPKLGDEVWKR